MRPRWLDGCDSLIFYVMKRHTLRRGLTDGWQIASLAELIQACQ